MGYEIKLDIFEGPIALLYHLIEKNKIDISDIPISTITDQYLEYMTMIDELNLELTSEFILMASTLLEIKSKLLLPEVEEDEEEDPRENLVKKLIEYKRYKLASEELKIRKENYDKINYKVKEEIEVDSNDFELEGINLSDILETYKNIISKYENREEKNEEDLIFSKIQRDDITVEEGIEIIVNSFKSTDILKIEDILSSMDGITKNKIITIFLALLELIKRKRVRFTQDETFGEILLEKI